MDEQRLQSALAELDQLAKEDPTMTVADAVEHLQSTGLTFLQAGLVIRTWWAIHDPRSQV